MIDYAGTYGDPTHPDWYGQNITTITSPNGVKFNVNKRAAEAFSGLLTDLDAAGYKVGPGSGGYNLRNITGGHTLSPHAFGIAIDINPADNPYSKDPNGGVLKTDLPPNIHDIAAKWGLTWGGDWKTLKDPMHFEFDKDLVDTDSGPTMVASAPKGASGVSPSPVVASTSPQIIIQAPDTPPARSQQPEALYSSLYGPQYQRYRMLSTLAALQQPTQSAPVSYAASANANSPTAWQNALLQKPAQTQINPLQLLALAGKTPYWA